LKYQDIEFTIVQGLCRELWNTIEDVTLKGQAATKSEAIAEAERAIDRSRSRRNLKVVSPDRE